MDEPIDTCLCEIAELYASKSDVASVEKCYQEALATNPSCSRAYLGMAKVFTSQENASLAMEYFDKAEISVKTLNEKANVLLCRSESLLALKQPNLALTTVRHLMSAFPILFNDPKMSGNIIGIISECYRANGDWDKAKKYAQKQLKIGLEIKNKEFVLNGFRILTDVYEQNGQLEQVVRLLEKQLDMLKSEGGNRSNDRSTLLRKCGSINSRIGNLKTAVSCYRECLELVSSIEEEIEVQAELARVYGKINDLDQTKSCLEQISRLIQENPGIATKFEWMYEEEMGEHHLDVRKLDEAKKNFERALMLVQENGDHSKEAELCLKLGKLHLQLDEDDETLVYFQQALMIGQQMKNVSIKERIGYDRHPLYDANLDIHHVKIIRRIGESPSQIKELGWGARVL